MHSHCPTEPGIARTSGPQPVSNKAPAAHRGSNWVDSCLPELEHHGVRATRYDLRIHQSCFLREGRLAFPMPHSRCPGSSYFCREMREAAGTWLHTHGLPHVLVKIFKRCQASTLRAVVSEQLHIQHHTATNSPARAESEEGCVPLQFWYLTRAGMHSGRHPWPGPGQPLGGGRSPAPLRCPRRPSCQQDLSFSLIATTMITRSISHGTIDHHSTTPITVTRLGTATIR